MGNIEDFHARNDQFGPAISTNTGWLLYSNGAMRETSREGALCDPSPNLYERAKNIRLYWQLRTQKAVSNFDYFRNGLNQQIRAAQAGNGCSPPGVALDQLKALAEEAKSARAKLTEAEADVEKNLPAGLRKMASDKIERASDATEFAAKLAKITI